MVMPQIKDEILDQLDQLPSHLQRRVVDFAAALVATRPKGVPGRLLIEHAGSIEPESLREMEAAIEEG